MVQVTAGLGDKMARHPDSEHLTLAQAAEHLAISPKTLERWARDGRIPSERTPEGSLVFRRDELLSRSAKMGDLPRKNE